MSPESSTTIHVPSSHLYRGMRLRTEGAQPLRIPMDGEQHEADILLFFSDDSTVPAHLQLNMTEGHILLVKDYMTAQGTDIPEKIWHIKGVEQQGDHLELWLGAPLQKI